MTIRISAILHSAIFLVTSLVVGPVLLAQPVFYDSRSPQASFAAAEIGRALGSKSLGSNGAMPDRTIRDLGSDNSPLRFAIAVDAAESKALAQTVRVAPLKTTAPQSYAIRRAETGGRVTIAVLGAPFSRLPQLAITSFTLFLNSAVSLISDSPMLPALNMPM